MPDENLHLPNTVVSKTDALRLVREIEAVDDFFTQAKIREAGARVVPPRSSQLLEEVAKLNGINLLEEQPRKSLKLQLKNVVQDAPVVHISFAANPSPRFMSEIADWFRKEIDPHILLQVGLQPSIAAGCVVRTTNKFFDLSLRKYLVSHEKSLATQMSGEKSE